MAMHRAMRTWRFLPTLTGFLALLGAALPAVGLPADSSLKVLSAADFLGGALVLPAEQSALVRIHPGGQVFRLHFAVEPEADRTAGAPLAGWIAVFRHADDRLLQRVRVPAFVNGDLISTSVAMMDLNFDGYLDLLVAQQSQTHETRYSTLFFDPTADQFVANELSAELDAVPGLPVPNPENREISVSSFSPECAVKLVQSYRILEGKLVLVREDTAQREGGSCVVSTQRRVDGTLQVTSTRTVTP